MLAAVVAAAIVLFAPLLGMHLPPATLAIVVLGAVVVDLLPTRPLETATGIGFLALASTNQVYAGYHLILVSALYFARRRTGLLVLVLGALAIALPKHLFQAHYHQPGFYNWINEPSLALALFVSARWWRERRDGRLPVAAEQASWGEFAALYFFPGHAANPIVYSATDLFRERRFDVRGVLVALSLLVSKSLAHAAIWRMFPNAGYATLDVGRAATLARAPLWGIVALNYLDLALTLSGTADLAVLIARLYGWPMPSPFRFALLAWNPGELWRRWGLYNRKFLLGLVYFPLGGGKRHRYRNVLLTFLASALLMHTGWFGSKYWQVGLAGWRDESVYFLLQGICVCTWLLCGDLRAAWARRKGRGGVPNNDDHAKSADPTQRRSELRFSWARVLATLATQGTSALVHVVILAQAMPLAGRLGLIARCLGMG